MLESSKNNGMNSAANEITIEHHLRELRLNIGKCATLHIEFWGLLNEDIPGNQFIIILL